MITSSIFFDSSMYECGEFDCYICGAKTSDRFKTSDYIKTTFGNRAEVFRPSSKFVCGGCVSTWREKTRIVMPDGEIREGQRIRQYSWVITKNFKQAYTKAHIQLLRKIILDPPDPPFAIVLADSGQKHLIFKSKINFNKEFFTVSLEEESILVDRKRLKEYLDFLIKPISVIGKIAIMDLSLNNLSEMEKNFSNEFEKMLVKINQIKNTGLFRLAVWLSPNKENCLEILNGNNNDSQNK